VPLENAYGDLECFSSGKIDAGFLVEPKLSLGEGRGLVQVIARVGDYFPRYQWGGIFAIDDFICKQEGWITAMMESYRDVLWTIRENPEAAIALGSRLFKIERAVFRKALTRDFDHWEMNAMIDLPGLENCLEIQEKLGAIPVGIHAEDMVMQF